MLQASVFVVVLLLAVLGHGYLWVAIVNRIHGIRGPQWFIDGVTIVCLVAFLTLPVWVVREGATLTAQWAGGIDYPVSAAIRYFQFCAVWCVWTLTLKATVGKSKNEPQTLRFWRREPVRELLDIDPTIFHGKFSQAVARLPANQILQLTIEHKRLALPRLHPKHAGITIAHVSDFHMTGRVDKRWFEAVVREVNQLRPDVVAITGDVVENPACLPWLAETVGRLEARLGVYFILGNHDRFIGYDPARERMTDDGHICLSGRWLVADWNGAPVLLAGNERPWLREVGDLDEAPRRDADGLPLRLFLLHTPDQISWARRHQADLVLAGHTHGGQVCLPVLGAVACPSLHGTKYTAGVYRIGDTVMHVTRGLSAKTPLRWNCPPEIAMLELVRG